MRYFQKEDVRNKVYTGAGWPIPFKDFGGQIGGIETTDGYIIEEIGKLISQKRGGVMEISANEFDNLKKKENQRSYPSWRELLAVRQLHRLRLAWERGNAAVDKKIASATGGYSAPVAAPRPAGPSSYRPQAVAR